MISSLLRVGWTALTVVLLAKADNVALNKPVYSSSVDAQNTVGSVGSANDGDTSNNAGLHPGCFASDETDSSPYWMVDLGEPFNIASVALTNERSETDSVLTDFTIEVYLNDPRPLFTPGAGQLCGGSAVETAVPNGARVEFSCGQAPLTGRWVAVRKNGTSLSLCEVEVVNSTAEEAFQNVPCAFKTDSDLCGFSKPAGNDFNLIVTDHISTATLVNVALNKPVTQSSYSKTFKAVSLTDGNRATSMRYCTHTLTNDPAPDPWFRVDLGEDVEVVAVVVTNRGDCCGHRTADFDILVSPTLPDPSAGRPEGSHLCVHRQEQIPSGGTLQLDCNSPVHGRYVTFIRANYTEPLNICELEVLQAIKTGIHIPTSASPGQQGQLHSPILDPSTGHVCLVFWYTAALSDQGPSLTVVTSSPDLTGPPLRRWTSDAGVSPLDPDAWRRAALTIDASSPIRVSFVFAVYNHNTSDGIDDVSLTDGHCLPQMPVRRLFACSLEAPDLCGLGQLTVDDDTLDWRWVPGRDDPSLSRPAVDSTTGTGAGHYLFIDRSSLPGPNNVAYLYTPAISPHHPVSCLSFAFIYQGDNSGGLHVLKAPSPFSLAVAKPVWFGMGRNGTSWRKATMEFPTTAPYNVFFAGKRDPIDDFGVIAIDDIDIKNGPCPVVPWTEDPAFRCDRPTTPCAPGRGACDPDLHNCTCTPPGALGLQCSLDVAPCTSTDPCERGTCNNQTGVATCSCPDGYYGDYCQHAMVYAECSNDTMTINIFPHGFHDNNFTLIKAPEIANTKSSCSLVDVSTLNVSSGVDAVSRGWQGYAGQFLLDDDPCAGSATLVRQDRWTKTYSRQVHVHYDTLRHPTDTVLTLTCTTPTPPAFRPKVTIAAKELGVSVFSLPPEGRQWPSYIQFVFSLNIPNTVNSDEISVERCTTNNGVETVVVIENGCVIHPVGVVMYDGLKPGVEFFIMRVFKRPLTPAMVGLQCSVRLCDSRKNNFACYRRKLCLDEGNRTRRRRSSRKVWGPLTGGSLINVTYPYTG